MVLDDDIRENNIIPFCLSIDFALTVWPSFMESAIEILPGL